MPGLKTLRGSDGSLRYIDFDIHEENEEFSLDDALHTMSRIETQRELYEILDFSQYVVYLIERRRGRRIRCYVKPIDLIVESTKNRNKICIDYCRRDGTDFVDGPIERGSLIESLKTYACSLDYVFVGIREDEDDRKRKTKSAIRKLPNRLSKVIDIKKRGFFDKEKEEKEEREDTEASHRKDYGDAANRNYFNFVDRFGLG